MLEKTCPEHPVLIERLKIGEDKMDEMAADIKDIKKAVIGDFSRPGLDIRVSLLEGVNRGVNKAAWAIGIPVILAAIFGAWKVFTGILGKP